VKQWRNFDFQLIGIPAGLVTFSVFVLFAISRWPTSNVPTSTPIKQAMYAAMGLAARGAIPSMRDESEGRRAIFAWRGLDAHELARKTERVYEGLRRAISGGV